MATRIHDVIPRQHLAEVSEITVTHGGAGYSSAPTVTIAGSATGTTTLDTTDTDAVASVTVTAKGRYDFRDGPPVVTVADPDTGMDVATAVATIVKTNRPDDLTALHSLDDGDFTVSNATGGNLLIFESAMALTDPSALTRGKPLLPFGEIGITVETQSSEKNAFYVWGEKDGYLTIDDA